MQSFHIHLCGQSGGPLPTSFEDVQERLLELPKLYFEPDGSFVWATTQGQEQVFGMVYDAMGVVRYCEIRGHCHSPTWDRLCQAVVGPTGNLSELQVLSLPSGKLQDLQSFVQGQWPCD